MQVAFTNNVLFSAYPQVGNDALNTQHASKGSQLFNNVKSYKQKTIKLEITQIRQNASSVKLKNSQQVKNKNDTYRKKTL